MTALSKSIYNTCQANKDGSKATQNERLTCLLHFARTVHSWGQKPQSVRGIKDKHTNRFFKEISHLDAGTRKNYAWHLRWLEGKTNKRGLIPKSNEDLGIPSRTANGENIAKKLDTAKLQNVTCDHAKMSIRLMAAFGLRRKESIMIRPVQADKGDKIALQASWTKGKVAREIPITTERQRALLNEAKKLAGNGALIPDGKDFYQQENTVDHQCRTKLNNGRKHAYRHNYAQWRYQCLTGWKCPKAGGKTKLTKSEKRCDRWARNVLTREMGHFDLYKTKVYIG